MTLAAGRDLGALRPGLERWLGRPVGDLRRPAPGFSCETLVIDDEVVIRLPPSGAGIFPTYDLAQQAAVQDAAARAGVPVAGPARYEPDPSFLGAPFLAMPFAPGPIPGDFTAGDPWLAGLPGDADRAAVWRSFLGVLPVVHRARAEGLGLRRGLAEELAWWQGYVAWATDGFPPPALVDALAWCADRRPASEPPGGLLWGDVRLGNVVFDPDRRAPRAVLDWDMAGVGPAEMDLAWFLALRAVEEDLTGTTVPGFGSREQAIAVVEAGLGRPLDDLVWYEVFALVRASAVSTRIALLFERAGRRSMFTADGDPTLAAAVTRIERSG
ncbi:MAG TPA: phosphotransferase family protein [Acidimicrobiales bacterium]|nr:phosphotransferase family protein [Acidimicrobiales bacterium]